MPAAANLPPLVPSAILGAAASVATPAAAQRFGEIAQTWLKQEAVSEPQRAAVSAALQLERISQRADEDGALKRAMDGAGAQRWADRLDYARQVAPYLGPTIETQNTLERLAPSQGLSSEAMTQAAFDALDPLRRSPHYPSLPAHMRQRFEQTLELFAIFKQVPVPAPRPPRQRPLAKPGEKIRGALKRAHGGTMEIVLDRKPSRSVAAFLVSQAEGGRRMFLKTARYVGLEDVSPRSMDAALAGEVRMLRLSRTISERPGFPAQVSIGRFEEFVELSPDLAEDIYGDAVGVPGFLMTLAEGAALDVYLEAGGKLSVQDFRALLDAYKRLHEAGLAHGDVNPGNILVAEKNGKRHFTLLDFGPAKLRGDRDPQAWNDVRQADLQGVAAILISFQDAGQLSGF